MVPRRVNPVTGPRQILAITLQMVLTLLLVACWVGPPSTVPTPSTTPSLPTGWITFAAGSEFDFEIFTMRADGSEVIQLTDTQAWEGGALWSPDGQSIAFVANRDGDIDLYTIRPDGSEETLLTHDNQPVNGRRSYGEDSDPVWSSDGQWLAFHSNRYGRYDIYVARPDGSEEIRLTDNKWNNYQPSWSPDAQWIVYSSSKRGPRVDLFLVRADGSKRIRLTNNPVWERAPSWSPDGQWIVFTTAGAPETDLFVIRPDGSEERQLIRVPGTLCCISWSPDSQWIAYVSDRDGDYEIYIIRPDASEELQLTNNMLSDLGPAWSPDGQWIAFVSELVENNCLVPRCTVPSEIFVIRPDGSGLMRVTKDTLPKYGLSWAPVGWSP